VNPYLAHGGAETAIIKLSEYLNHRGIENAILALIATKGFIQNSDESDLDIRVKNILSFGKSFLGKEAFIIRRMWRFSSDLLTLRQFVASQKKSFDMLNPHNFPSPWTCILNRKPVIWMMNEPPDLYFDVSPSPLLIRLRDTYVNIDQLLVRNFVDQICVNSFLTCEQAKQRYGKESEIVLFGIEYDEYCKGNPSEVIEKYDLENRFVIITVGALGPQKNQLASIKAIEKVRKLIPNVKLVIAGRGVKKYEDTLKRFVKSKELTDSVLFTGFLTETEKKDLYHACHIGLYPFREQGGLLVPFETLCAAKPVIVSPNNGSADIIRRNRLGIATNNYADAIYRIFSNYNEFT